MALQSWFFQANSDIYRVRDALSALKHLRWSVRQFQSEIHVGDTVYVWESGPSGGLLAQARVTSEPAEGTDPPHELSFYVTPPTEQTWIGVELDIERDFSKPLKRIDLQAETALEDTLLIKNPRGTNFPLTVKEAAALQQLLTAKPSFREVIQRYFDEHVVFSSPERGHHFCITAVDENGCQVASLSGQESAGVIFSLHETRLAALRQQGGRQPTGFLDDTMATRVALLQSPELGLSPDRESAISLSDEDTAVDLLCDLLKELNVDRSAGMPRLYKPALLGSLIEAIGDGEILDHRIGFDILLPRFIAKLNSLDVEGGPDQAALAFFHLAGDLFWNLAYVDSTDRVDSGSVTPSSIRRKISHAVLKEPFRWLLRKHANRQRVLEAIAAEWWPQKDDPMQTHSFWWVNQGQTFEEEKEAGIIWAPQADKGGKPTFHWENVGKVKANDIVFHYANGSIVAVSKCSESGTRAPKPASLGTSWQEDGWMAKTAYTVLATAIPLQNVAKPIRKLGLKYCPINKSDGVNQGYLYALSPAAVRVIAEQLDINQLPSSIANSLRHVLGKQRDAFIHWAARFWDNPNVRETERDYKVAAGNLLSESHAALTGGGDWFTPLRRAFQGKNNLTDYRSHDPFLKWCQDESDGAKRFLQSVWNPSVDAAEAVATGLAILPIQVVTGAGTRNNITSFVAMGRNATDCPIYKSDPFKDGCRLTGFPAFFSLAEAQYYGHALAFLDRIKSEAAVRGLALVDRLDAQSVLWCVTKYDPPESWPANDRQALLAFRAGAQADNSPAHDSLNGLATRLFMDVEFLRDIKRLIEAKRQIIFFGPPGTGKTYVAKMLAEHFARSAEQFEIVQFHPSYAYEDFVEGYRPNLNDGQPGFRLGRGPLRRLAAKARKDPGSTFVLLIDEINRGNVAKVFGELYFLLEYRDEEISLQYSRKRFALPPNLWVIGTMNTADRSIALIDAALRRRFYFIPFFPDEPPVSRVLRAWLAENKPGFVWLADAVDAANAKLGNRHSAIGPSYFMRPDLDDEWLRLIWKHAITPYLAEQFFGDEDRVKEFDLETLRRGLNPSL